MSTSSSLTTLLLQTISISISLLASGSILTISLFTIPMLQSQSASHSLPELRWLFSRGSHVFPTAAIISSLGFFTLAIASFDPGQSAIQILQTGLGGNARGIEWGYVVAGMLCLAIAPWTSLVMIPTNFALIALNENLAGARSQKSAVEANTQKEGKEGKRSAEASVIGKGDVDEFTDLSLPQGRTEREGTEEEERRVRELHGKFGALNAVRGVLIGGGGGLGLWFALK